MDCWPGNLDRSVITIKWWWKLDDDILNDLIGFRRMGLPYNTMPRLQLETPLRVKLLNLNDAIAENCRVSAVYMPGRNCITAPGTWANFRTNLAENETKKTVGKLFTPISGTINSFSASGFGRRGEKMSEVGVRWEWGGSEVGGRKREREEGRQIEKGTKDRKRLKKTLNKLNKQIQIRQPNEIGTAERRHKLSTATKINIQKMYKHAYIYIYI